MYVALHMLSYVNLVVIILAMVSCKCNNRCCQKIKYSSLISYALLLVVSFTIEIITYPFHRFASLKSELKIRQRSDEILCPFDAHV